MNTRIASYEKDPYLRELESEVIQVGSCGNRPFAILRDTIFYPELGGQPADHGLIGAVPVRDVRLEGGQVRHYLESMIDCGRTTLTLDWERRFDHMQQHTSQHLLTALAQDRFRCSTTAFHLGAEISDIDLDVPALSLEQVQALEETAAAEVRAARPVKAFRVSPDRFSRLNVRTRGLPAGHRGSVRLVNIKGIDLNTCGGTHLRSTAEIESIKLLHTESVRQGTRLYFVAGGRLRRRMGENEFRNARMRTLLGVPDHDLLSALESRLHQLKEWQRREKILLEELSDTAAETLARRPGRLVEAHFKGGGGAFLQELAHRLREKAPHKVGFLTAGAEGAFHFAIVAGDDADLNVQPLGLGAAVLLEGKGGGKGKIFQGKAKSLDNRHAVLDSFPPEFERG